MLNLHAWGIGTARSTNCNSPSSRFSRQHRSFTSQRSLNLLALKPRKGFWASARDALTNSLVYKLKIERFEDWHNVKFKQFQESGCVWVLRYYNNCRTHMFQSLFPEHHWQPWKYGHVSKGFWDDMANQRNAADDLAVALHITHWAQWYNVPFEQITAQGGGGLLRYYDDSHARMLQTIYPEFPWARWRFQRVSGGFWKKKKNQRTAVAQLATELKIGEWDEWYQVTSKQIKERGGGGLLSLYYNSLEHMLQTLVPEHQWLSWKFHQMKRVVNNGSTGTSLSKPLSMNISAGEASLRRALQYLFPNHTPYFNYSAEVLGLVHPSTGFAMELDVFYADLGVALEYQGRQHYRDTFQNGRWQHQQRRDKEKRDLCAQHGITLIHVPFWWDETPTSLAATILKHAPQLSQILENVDMTGATPIPEREPLFQKIQETAKSEPIKHFIKVNKFQDWLDPTHRILTEQYDGIRAIWNGNAFLPRRLSVHTTTTNPWQRLPHHHTLVPPEWMQRQLPEGIYLDGELWCGYGSIEELQSIFRRPTLAEEDWKKIQFVIFDSPDLTIRDKPYLQRLQHIQKLLPRLQDPQQHGSQHHVKLIYGEQCQGLDHLHSYLSDVLQRGGEGVVLRDGSAAYLPGYQMWKKKDVFYGKAQVRNVVTGTQSVICRNEFGIEFSLNVLPDTHTLSEMVEELQRRQDIVMTYGFYGVSPKHMHPISPFMKEWHRGDRWSEVCTYEIVSQNVHSLCASCRSKIPMGSLCVKVPCIYHYRTPRMIPVSFCLSAACLDVVADYYKEKNGTIRAPPFMNKIAVS